MELEELFEKIKKMFPTLHESVIKKIEREKTMIDELRMFQINPCYEIIFLKEAARRSRSAEQRDVIINALNLFVEKEPAYWGTRKSIIKNW